MQLCGSHSPHTHNYTTHAHTHTHTHTHTHVRTYTHARTSAHTHTHTHTHTSAPTHPSSSQSMQGAHFDGARSGRLGEDVEMSTSAGSNSTSANSTWKGRQGPRIITCKQTHITHTILYLLQHWVFNAGGANFHGIGYP